MTIKQTMSTAIPNDPNNVKAVVNEATDGKKAIPTELVLKASDDSTFTQVTDSNPLPTKLTGSKASQKKSVTIANALAITDISQWFYRDGSMVVGVPGGVADWNNYNRRAIEVRNTLNQAVDLVLVCNLRGSTSFDQLNVGVSEGVQKVSIPANGGFSPRLITSDDLRALDGLIVSDVSIGLKAPAAPTSGSITVKLVMWDE